MNILYLWLIDERRILNMKNVCVYIIFLIKFDRNMYKLNNVCVKF